MHFDTVLEYPASFSKHRVSTYKRFSLHCPTENAHQKPPSVEGGQAAVLHQAQVYAFSVPLYIIACCVVLDASVLTFLNMALCRHRSLNDKNKILLTSFFNNDIPKLIKNARTKDNTHKTARMYADISCFLEGVCRDIKIMYPSTSGDYQYVQRLFTRLMDTPSDAAAP